MRRNKKTGKIRAEEQATTENTTQRVAYYVRLFCPSVVFSDT